LLGQAVTTAEASLIGRGLALGKDTIDQHQIVKGKGEIGGYAVGVRIELVAVRNAFHVEVTYALSSRRFKVQAADEPLPAAFEVLL
jgi:hypothetical protein